MWSRLFLYFFVFDLLCSTVSAKSPLDFAAELYDSFSKPSLNINRCRSILERAHSEIVHLDPKILVHAHPDELTRAANQLASFLMLLNSHLNHTFEFHQLEENDHFYFRSAFRISLYLISEILYYRDVILPWRIKEGSLKSFPKDMEPKDPSVFAVDSSKLRISPDGTLDVSAFIDNGTNILTRAGKERFVSPFIGRISTSQLFQDPYSQMGDSPLSHAYIVHIDPVTGKTHLEALIEDNVLVRPFQEPVEKVKKDLAYLVITRFEDTQVRAAGADAQKIEIQSAMEKGSPHLYSFDFRGWYCSAMVCRQIEEGYRRVYGKEISPPFPLWQTPIYGSPQILNAMGITPGQMASSPGDIAIARGMETQVLIVEPVKAHLANLSNAVLDVMLRKMNSEGYEVIPGWTSQVLRTVVHPIRANMRDWPIYTEDEFFHPFIYKLAHKLQRSFPSHMPAELLEFIHSAEKVFLEILSQLKQRDLEAIRERFYPLTYPEMISQIEDILAEDRNSSQKIYTRFQRP